MNKQGETLQQSITRTFKEHGLKVSKITFVPDLFGDGEVWEVTAS